MDHISAAIATSPDGITRRVHIDDFMGGWVTDMEARFLGDIEALTASGWSFSPAELNDTEVATNAAHPEESPRIRPWTGTL